DPITRLPHQLGRGACETLAEIGALLPARQEAPFEIQTSGRDLTTVWSVGPVQRALLGVDGGRGGECVLDHRAMERGREIRRKCRREPGLHTTRLGPTGEQRNASHGTMVWNPCATNQVKVAIADPVHGDSRWSPRRAS